jgi:transcriptional regulator with XRE-family HTH domain
MDIYEGVALRVRELRLAHGWSQHQLAAEAGLSADGVSRIERGDRTPRLGTLEEIAIALGISLPQLVDVGQPLPEIPKVDAKTLALQRLLDQLAPKLARLLVTLIRCIVRVVRSK